MPNNDPMNLLGETRPSEHCKDKKSTTVMYDHTGYVLDRCECGEHYWWSIILRN